MSGIVSGLVRKAPDVHGVGALLGGWDGKDRRTGGRNPWRGAERRMSA